MRVLTVADAVVLCEGEGAEVGLEAALGWPLEEARGLLLEAMSWGAKASTSHAALAHHRPRILRRKLEVVKRWSHRGDG